jgi:hypothetical protein
MGRSGDMAGRTFKKKIRETIIAILTRYDVERIAIFGSYARGEAGAKSDIDILVRFAHPKSLLQIVRIEEEIEESLRIPVDLITEKAVSPYLTDSIRRDEVVIYG